MARTAPAIQGERPALQKPVIDKVDPPGWWAGLPSPMLLVHGQGLNSAHFRVDGSGVKLTRTQTSENGHWAFLWLETREAAAQTISIVATNDLGQAISSYQLAQRTASPDAHAGFSSSDVLYLIMIDRFARGRSEIDPPGNDRAAPRGWHGGNFAGIEDRLDYLKQLGVTTLWTTPVASNEPMPETYHGYAATDLYAVDPHFGTLAEYRHLSDALHARGMKLVIDLAPNHIGVTHPWVNDPPAPEWLHGTLEHHRKMASDFYLLTDPHAPPERLLDVTSGWFTNAMPDLNQENPLVAAYLIQNAMWWVEEANIDGIRLDTFPYVGRAFWQQFDAALHGVYPHLTMVGEIFNPDPEVTSFFAGGATHQGIDTGLDTPFDFPLCFALRAALAEGKPMTEVAAVLMKDALYPHPERLATFIGNHDTSRFLTDASGSAAKLKLAIGLLATLRGMPLIYSGDEIGMAGGGDPDNRRDFPGGFAGDAHSAFTASTRTAAQQDVFAWTSALLNFRAAHGELKTGVEQNLFADTNAMAFVRAQDASGCASDHAREEILVVVNNAAHEKTVDLPMEGTALAGCASFEPAAGTANSSPRAQADKLSVTQPAESLTVYAVR